MIFNEQISNLAGARPPAAPPAHAGGRHRVRQPRVLDQRPPRAAAAVLQLPDADPEFAWEVAAIGINLVSMANNHALDFGPEGLAGVPEGARPREHHATPAPASPWPRRARPAPSGVQSQKTRFALLSYMRYWTSKYRCADPSGPCLATIDPADDPGGETDGKVEDGRGPARGRRRRRWRTTSSWPSGTTTSSWSSLHNHDVSHHRAYGIQDTTPAQRRDHVPPGDRRRRGHGHRQRARTSCAASRSTRGSRSSTASPTSSTSTGPRTRSRSTSSTSATPRSRGRPTSRCGTAATRARSSRGSWCG